uniref:Uncharacterized protein n=1 Tax=Anopheles atroparvus TaxID=41427 RepID=A0A182JBT6_ANOAO
MVMMAALLLTEGRFLVGQIIPVERAVGRRVRIERDHRHPRSVALPACHHSLLVQRKHRHQIVLSAHDDVLSIRAPANAQETAKVGPGDPHQLHVLVVEDAQEAVLRHDGQMLTARCASCEGQCWAANFMRFCFWRWLQNQTRTTFFFKSSFSAMAAIFSPEGLGWTANTLGASGSLRLFFAWASASSSHACRIGFSAIMLLWDRVKLSKRQMVLCDSAPTPESIVEN